MVDHIIKVIEKSSPHVGLQCPISHRELIPGDQVIVCRIRGEAFSWDALPMLEGQCPYCGERIELDKILNVSYDPAPSGEDKSEKLPQKPPPTIEPSAQRVGLSGFVILLIAAGGLGLLGLCGFGGFLGYQQFLAPSGDAMVTPWVTQAPEQALIASTATSVPTSKPTTIPAPTQTPRPTSIPKPTSIPFPSPTPCAFSVSSRFAAAWNQYADQLGCPINQSHSHDAATQDYERGFLLWRVQPDQVYVMHDAGLSHKKSTHCDIVLFKHLG